MLGNRLLNWPVVSYNATLCSRYSSKNRPLTARAASITCLCWRARPERILISPITNNIVAVALSEAVACGRLLAKNSHILGRLAELLADVGLQLFVLLGFRPAVIADDFALPVDEDKLFAVDLLVDRHAKDFGPDAADVQQFAGHEQPFIGIGIEPRRVLA